MSVVNLPDIARMRTIAFAGYRPGKPATTPAGKLSSNESALGPAPGVNEAVAVAMRDAHRYPDLRPLRRMVAAQERMPEDAVVVTNGSDELCYLLASLFVEPDAKVVLSDPCYQIDAVVTRLYRGRPEFVPLRADGGQDLDAMLAHAQDAKLVWLPTPHNPTGIAVGPDELHGFLEAVPSACLVVLDEAYRAYVDGDRRPAVPELLGRYSNLIVQRTFSKDYALAGLRIGYGLGDPAVIDAIERIKPPFSVSATAIAAAQAALARVAWRDYGVELAVRERRRLEATLDELDVTYFPSQANFVTLTTPHLERLARALHEAGLVIRDGSDLGLPGWVRISVGSPPAMARLRAVLKEVL
ncbi:MAG TPA: histidinol-phosphate transaminase [Solirubrobacteraceae bacterium]